MVKKLEGLIADAQRIGEPVEDILAIQPDLMLAAATAIGPRQIAETLIWADSLSSLLSRVDMAGEPSCDSEAIEYLEGQSLRSFVEDLANEGNA